MVNLVVQIALVNTTPESRRVLKILSSIYSQHNNIDISSQEQLFGSYFE